MLFLFVSFFLFLFLQCTKIEDCFWLSISNGTGKHLLFSTCISVIFVFNKQRCQTREQPKVRRVCVSVFVVLKECLRMTVTRWGCRLNEKQAHVCRLMVDNEVSVSYNHENVLMVNPIVKYNFIKAITRSKCLWRRGSYMSAAAPFI